MRTTRRGWLAPALGAGLLFVAVGGGPARAMCGGNILMTCPKARPTAPSLARAAKARRPLRPAPAAAAATRLRR